MVYIQEQCSHDGALKAALGECLTFPIAEAARDAGSLVRRWGKQAACGIQ